jgi:hypothetical protein
MTAQDDSYNKISEILGELMRDNLKDAIQKIVEIGNGKAVSLAGYENENLKPICQEFMEQLASVDLKLEINPQTTVQKREKVYQPMILLPSGRRDENPEILAPSLGLNTKLVY